MSSVKCNGKLLVKNVEHKLEEAFSDGKRDVQLGRFILLSVPFPHQLPSFTSLYLFSFLNLPLKLALFADNIQMVRTIKHS